MYVFPELSVTGYSLDDVFLQSDLHRSIDGAVERLVEHQINQWADTGWVPTNLWWSIVQFSASNKLVLF